MDRFYDDELAERIEISAERYWLQGMDLGYSKRRALVEHTRLVTREADQVGPVVQFS